MKQPMLMDMPPTTETPVMRDTLVAVSALSETLAYRNNTGVARTMAGGWIRFGLVGSGDIMGCHKGRAFAIETKRPKGGRFEETQLNFKIAWERAGGLYIPARHPDDALQILTAL